MLYIGAEYCPYCAAERWAMVVALSRFGTLSGLGLMHSAAEDGAGQAEPYPNTATWTFAHASYASKYLTFTPVETYTNVPDPATGFYTPLQTLTAEQQALLTKYDSANGGAIPFIDYGNKYLTVGASYDPGVLAGLTWNQIAADLHNPVSPVAARGARHRQLHHRGDLRADEQPARVRVHAGGEVVAGEDLTWTAATCLFV